MQQEARDREESPDRAGRYCSLAFDVRIAYLGPVIRSVLQVKCSANDSHKI